MEKELRRNKIHRVQLEPLKAGTQELYCRLGEQAYRDHYLHLWPDRDPTPYISTSFTQTIVSGETKDKTNLHYLVRLGTEYIGIVKLIKFHQINSISLQEPMYLEKIYFLSQYTGKGYGKEILAEIEAISLQGKMKTLWLATMKKGFPLRFYQNLGFEIIGEQELPFKESIPEQRGMYILGKSLRGAIESS
ncbi:GNAT family N-acetyltransferase [Muriicola soli]|uniref:GNAT family N-acetyltransferase n=1 Tax=Muriicola soli TaxID=2507538 RepID=A0A411EAH7_9FLAO|nr:GNAT family N-acetyltransferase [Muriicola soli]QBA64679.1 GNAT family N-acetyltransferase [Muriicola soli]